MPPGEHWTVGIEYTPQWRAFVDFIEAEAADTTRRLLRSEPGSPAQAKIVGELAALSKIVELPGVARQAATRELRLQAEAETRKTRETAA